MDYIDRIIDLIPVLHDKSCFLFGPRQTGKTWIIKNRLQRYAYFNLLDTNTYAKFAYNPGMLKELIGSDEKIVIIDEIQRLPVLLNEVQLLIDDRGVHFLLTGSSARKLKRKGVNLLGGRARIRNLHPFVYKELSDRFNLNKALEKGLIPPIYLSNAPDEDLESYIGTYLREEVAAEALVRNIPAFSRFLTVAALSNGGIINYSNISSDSQVPNTTIQEYFQILRDTLIGADLPVWKKSRKRKPISTSKFYFFDIGVVRYLQGRTSLAPGTTEYGEALETFIFHELHSYIDYSKRGNLHFWRSVYGQEVDFILNETAAIEVKSKPLVSGKDLKSLRVLKDEELLSHFIVIHTGEDIRITEDAIQIIPWYVFLDRLWSGEYDIV
jgi:uncharacterized protein